MRITESQLRRVVRRLVLEQAEALPKTAQELSDMMVAGLQSRWEGRDDLVKQIKVYAKKFFDLYNSEIANPPKEGASRQFNDYYVALLALTDGIPQAYKDHNRKLHQFFMDEKQRKIDRKKRGAAARRAAFEKHEAGPRFTQADIPQLKALIDGEGEPSPGIERRFNGAVRADFKFETNYLLDDLVALGFDKGAVSDLIDETEEALGLGYGSSGYYGSYSGATRDERRSRGQV